MPSIREFLSDRVIFLTGGTGFLGKALVEKILREAPEIRRLYLLIRPDTRANTPLATPAASVVNDLVIF